jgi:hypothetical protein
MKEMIPSYGQDLVSDADLLREVRANTLDTLKLV